MLPCRRSCSNTASSWEQTLPVNGDKLQQQIGHLKKRNIEKAAKTCPGLVQALFDFSWKVHCDAFESGVGGMSLQLGPWQAPISHRQISTPDAGGTNKFRVRLVKSHQSTPNSGRRKSGGDRDTVHSEPKRRRVGSDGCPTRTHGTLRSRREGGNAQSDQYTYDGPIQQDQDSRSADQSNRTGRTTGEDDPAAPPPEGPDVARDSRCRQFEESQQRGTAGDGGAPSDQFTIDSGVDDSTGPIHAPAAEPPFPGTPSRASPTNTDRIGSENFSPLSTATNNSHSEIPVQNTAGHPHPGTIAFGEQSNPPRDGVEDSSVTCVDCQNMEGQESAPEIVHAVSPGNPFLFPTAQPMDSDVRWLDCSDEDAHFLFDMGGIQGNIQNMEGQRSAPAIIVNGDCGSTENPSLFPISPLMEGTDAHPWFDRSDGGARIVFNLEDTEIKFD